MGNRDSPRREAFVDFTTSLAPAWSVAVISATRDGHLEYEVEAGSATVSDTDKPATGSTVPAEDGL